VSGIYSVLDTAGWTGTRVFGGTNVAAEIFKDLLGLLQEI